MGNRFKAAFTAQSAEGAEIRSADEMDRLLHRERMAKQRPRCAAVDLPAGAMIALEGFAWLKVGRALRLWTPAGYTDQQPVPAAAVELLTPAATVQAIANGYVPRSTSAGWARPYDRRGGNRRGSATERQPWPTHCGDGLGADLYAFGEGMGQAGAAVPGAIVEAPLFVPARATALDVLYGRREGPRSWGVPARAATVRYIDTASGSFSIVVIG